MRSSAGLRTKILEIFMYQELPVILDIRFEETGYESSDVLKWSTRIMIS